MMENKCKRFLSLLLAFVMVLGMFPAGYAHVHAEETPAAPEAEINYVICFKNSNGQYRALTADYYVWSGCATLKTELYNGEVADNILWTMVESGDGYLLRAVGGTNLNNTSSAGLYLHLNGTSTRDARVKEEGEVMTLVANGDGSYLIKNPSGHYVGANGDDMDVSGCFGNQVTGTPVYFMPVVNLNVGDSVSFDVPGDYSNPDTEALGDGVVSVEADTTFEYEVNNKPVTELRSGKQYVIYNWRAKNNLTATGKAPIVSNVPKTKANETKPGLAMVHENSSDVAYEQTMWTFTQVSGNTYTIQDCDGKYLTLVDGVDNEVTLNADTACNLTVEYIANASAQDGGYWRIGTGNAWLNPHGGLDPERAASYSHANARTDEGSRWVIYEAHVVEDGERYAIVNNRADQTLNSNPKDASDRNGQITGLTLYGTIEALAPNAVWTIDAIEGSDGYSFMNGGKYMSFADRGASTVADPVELKIERNGSNLVIQGTDGGYLNDFGALGYCAAGWRSADPNTAKTDAGSQWKFHRITSEEATTHVTITAVKGGATTFTIGDMICNITVNEVHVHNWAPATCIAPETCTSADCNETRGEVDPTNHVNTRTIPGTPPTMESTGTADSVYCDDCQNTISGGETIDKLKAAAQLNGGTVVSLVNCEYTFTSDNKLVHDGIYIGLADDDIDRNGKTPGTTTGETIEVSAIVGDRVRLKVGGSRWIHFYNTKTNAAEILWDRCSGDNHTAQEHDLYLFKADENAADGSLIPGYTKVTSLEENGKYLIVAKHNSGSYYVMVPSTTTTALDHIALLLTTHVHEYDWDVTTDAGCTSNGVKTGTCSCGDTKTETIPALGHCWDRENAGDCVTDYTCCKCGYAPNPNFIKVYFDNTKTQWETVAAYCWGTNVEGWAISQSEENGIYTFLIHKDVKNIEFHNGSSGSETILTRKFAVVAEKTYSVDLVKIYFQENNAWDEIAVNCRDTDGDIVGSSVSKTPVDGKHVLYVDKEEAAVIEAYFYRNGEEIGEAKFDVEAGKTYFYPECTHTPAADDGDCTTAIMCTVCGQVATAAKSHAWAEEGTYTDPTFEADGYTTYNCTNSGCNETNVVTHEGSKLVAVAMVGEQKFETLAAAVAAAENGDTVELLSDTHGDGIIIDKSINIYLNGFTYTIDGTLVGSAGTQSNGFQILEGNRVMIGGGNGKIVMSENAVRGHDGLTGNNYVIQTYADSLVLNFVTITGNSKTSYVVSINSGKVNFAGTVNINAPEGAVAFDVCKYANYNAPTVNFGARGTIKGDIEVTGGILLMRNAGTIEGALKYTSGYFAKDRAITLAAPTDYHWVDAENEGQEMHEIAPHEYMPVKVVAPTCENGGYTDYKCSCGLTDRGEFTNSLGHTWGEPDYTDNGDGTHTAVTTCVNDSTHTESATDAHTFVDGTCVCGAVEAVHVAMIGEETYASLADAIKAAKAGDTITFVADITENVTINKSVTIDGADKTFTGQMKLTNRANITIKNVNFDGKGYNGYAVEAAGVYYITIEDCTAENYGYGFVQLASATVLTTVKNVTVSNMNYGVKVDYSTAVVLENVDITAKVAAVLNSNYGEKTITIKNSKLNILGTWTRNNTIKTTYTFEGANSIDEFITDTAIDNFKLAAGATLTAPQDITVTTDVANSIVVYENGMYKVIADPAAKIGETGYATLAAAIAAAKTGDTIVLQKDITENVTINKSVTINGAGKTYTGTMTGNNGLTITIENVNFVNGGFSKTTKSSTGTYTIKNCTFDGQGTYAYPVRIRGANKLVVEDCVVSNYLYSFLYVYSGTTTVSVKNVTVENCPNYAVYFASGVNNATFENLTVKNSNNGFVINNTANRSFTIKDCKMENVGTAINYSSGTKAITCTAQGNNDFGTAVLSEYAKVVLTENATLTAPEGLNVTTNVENHEVKYENGTYKVAEITVAKIGKVEYTTLREAVDAAEAGQTITLLRSTEGAGVVINKNLTIDFAGHTYSLTEPVGSTGTESNGFQILKGNTVRLLNGKLEVAPSAADKFYILVQNYANLTVQGMILDGTNLDKYALTDGDSYTLSNNCGSVDINKSTVIANNDGALAFAFDVCDQTSMGYSLPKVVVYPSSVIDGNIEAVAKSGNTYYATLQQAVDAVKASSNIYLVRDCSGAGVVINKKVNIDFKGFTYTFSGDPVGSTGTETLGFQILAGAEVELRNGTLKVADSAASKYAVLVMNYANLGLTNMTLDGTNLDHTNVSYALSNNSGKVTIKSTNPTTIIANDRNGAGDYAFDVYDYSSAGYALPTLVVNSGSKLNVEGKIDAAASIYSGKTVYYATLQQAIEAATNNQTITLVSDIKVDADDVVRNSDNRIVMFEIEGKSLKLDMNGKTIDVAYDSNEAMFAVFHIAEGASLTVKGNGKVNLTTGDTKAGKYDCVYYMFWKQGTTGTLNIVDGTFTANKVEDSMVYTNGNRIVTVKGGTWTLQNVGTKGNQAPWIFNTAGQNANAIIVTGGTYNFNVAKQYYAREVSIEDAKGNLSYVVDNGDGTWTVSGQTAEVAIVTDTWKSSYLYGYATFKDAVASIAAGAPETTIRLLKDITVKGQFIGHSYAQKVVIDLNGHKMSSADKALTVYRAGTEVTVKNGTVNGNTTGGTIQVTYGGKLTLGENVTIKSGGQANAIKVDANSTLIIDQDTTYVLGGKNDLIVADGANVQISAGYFKKPVQQAWCAEGYVPTDKLENGYYSVMINPAYGKVAQIGDTYYETLVEAVNAAADGDTITVLADIAVDTSAVVANSSGYAAIYNIAEKDITINLNGKKIEATVNAADLESYKDGILLGVFCMDTNGKLSLTGEGTVTANLMDAPEAPTASKLYSLMAAYGAGSELVVENGTFHANSVNSSLVYSQYDEIITINGGTYTLGNLGKGSNGSPWLFNAKGQNTQNILVNGGTFSADIQHQYYPFEVKMPKELALKKADGMFTVVPAVAYVNEQEWSSKWYTNYVGYATVEEAEAAAEGIKTKVVGKKTYYSDCEVVTLLVKEEVNLEDVLGGEIAGVDLPAGEFTLPSTSGDVSITGTKDTVITVNDVTAQQISMSGVTVKSSGAAYTGIKHSEEVVFNDCTIVGNMYLYAENVVFTNCTFDLSETNDYIWVYGAKNVTFKDCTFNTMGKAILVFQDGSTLDQTVTVEGCTFNATQPGYNWNQTLHIAAVSMDGSQGGTYNVILNNNTVDSDFNGLWQDKTGAGNITVTVDGTTVLTKN